MRLERLRTSLFRNPLLLYIISVAVSYSLPILALAEADARESPDVPGFIFWEYDYKEALKIARRHDTVVVAYVYSNDCDRCQKMDRDTDGSRFLRDAPGYRLYDPARGVGGKPGSPSVVECIHRLDQAYVALLNQIGEGKSFVHVLLSKVHNQP